MTVFEIAMVDFPAFSWVLSLWLAGWLVGGKSCLSRVCLSAYARGPAESYAGLAMQSPVLATLGLSLRPSVRLSHAGIK